jgi:hypothetical protein
VRGACASAGSRNRDDGGSDRTQHVGLGSDEAGHGDACVSDPSFRRLALGALHGHPAAEFHRSLRREPRRHLDGRTLACCRMEQLAQGAACPTR